MGFQIGVAIALATNHRIHILSITLVFGSRVIAVDTTRPIDSRKIAPLLQQLKSCFASFLCMASAISVVADILLSYIDLLLLCICSTQILNLMEL